MVLRRVIRMSLIFECEDAFGVLIFPLWDILGCSSVQFSHLGSYNLLALIFWPSFDITLSYRLECVRNV